MVSAIIADGYLLKKKRDDKRSFMASKYQRRYFELTDDTLAYAKDPRELKDGGGDIEVFAIHELKYIKKFDGCKLEMKFPERVLRIKAENATEHNRWYEAVKDARQKKLDGNNTPQAKQLETLKEHTKQQILTALEEDSDEDTLVGGAAAAAKKVDPQLAPLSHGQQQPSNGPLNNRPPSPRSLLANPRMGTMIIATPAHQSLQQEEEQQEEEQQPLQAAAKPRSRWQDEEDEEEATQQQQHQGQENSSTGKMVAAAVPAAATAPQRPPPPPSERLMLKSKPQEGLTNAGAPRGGTGTGHPSGSDTSALPPAVPRGEKLQLGNSARPAASAVMSAQPPSRENAEKLCLGGPNGSSATSRVAGGARKSGNDRVTPIPDVAASALPSEGPREEWEDDDWDSSDDDDKGQRKRKAAAPFGAPPPQPQCPASSEPLATVSGGGRSSSSSGQVEGVKSGGAAAAPPPRNEDEVGEKARSRAEHLGASGDLKDHPGPAAPVAAPGAPKPAARASMERGGGMPRPPFTASSAPAPAAGTQPKSKAAVPSRLQPQQRPATEEEEDEEEDKEAVLAKDAAGMDHLEDNWDSDEDDNEREPPPPKKAQGRPVPPPPSQPPPAPKAAPTLTKPSLQPPQRRIPGPPCAATTSRPVAPPVAGPHGSSTGIARPPTASNHLPAAPPSTAVGARTRGRASSEGSAALAKGTGRGAPSAAGPRGGPAPAQRPLHAGVDGGQAPALRSNVVPPLHDKADDGNWVEEDWDDDD